MPKLAANISWLYTELPFLERFGAAAACGFKGVECGSPSAYPVKDMVAALQAAGLQQVLFNVGEGDPKAGDRGITAIPGREKDFDAAIDMGIEYATALECPRIHVTVGRAVPGADLDAMEKTFRSNLKRGSERCARHGIEVVIEPTNTRDNPGSYLNTTTQAVRTIQAVGAPNLKLQLDLYHLQIAEGDLTNRIHALGGYFTHIQIAGNPDRNEPDRGEVNYPYLFELLDDCGFDGWVAAEYRPRTTTRDGLGWARPYGIAG